MSEGEAIKTSYIPTKGDNLKLVSPSIVLLGEATESGWRLSPDPFRMEASVWVNYGEGVAAGSGSAAAGESAPSPE